MLIFYLYVLLDFRIQVIISGEYDYSNPVVQRQIENLTQTFENTSYISSNRLYTKSWLREFLQYVERNQDYLDISINNKEKFISTLKEVCYIDFKIFKQYCQLYSYLLQLYLGPTSTNSLDVKFNEKGENIIAMRFFIQAVNISGTEHEKQMVRALRKICQESPLNATVFHPYFVFFDQVKNSVITFSLFFSVLYLRKIFRPTKN